MRSDKIVKRVAIRVASIPGQIDRYRLSLCCGDRPGRRLRSTVRDKPKARVHIGAVFLINYPILIHVRSSQKPGIACLLAAGGRELRCVRSIDRAIAVDIARQRYLVRERSRLGALSGANSTTYGPGASKVTNARLVPPLD